MVVSRVDARSLVERGAASLRAAGDAAGAWLAARAPRERVALAAAGGALLLTVWTFGVWRPLNARIHALESDLPALRAEADEARRLADALRRGGGPRPASGDVLSTVERAAETSGARAFITRLKPVTAMSGLNGQARLRVHLKSAPWPALARFLGALAGAGLPVREARISATETPGRVSADVLIGD